MDRTENCNTKNMCPFMFCMRVIEQQKQRVLHACQRVIINTKIPKLDSAQELSLSVKMGSSAEMSGVVCMDQETMALWRPLQNQPQSNDALEIEQSKSVAEASASALDAEGEPEQGTFAVAASATSEKRLHSSTKPSTAGVPTQKKKNR